MKSVQYAKQLANLAYGNNRKQVKDIKMIQYHKCRITFFGGTELIVGKQTARTMAYLLTDDDKVKMDDKLDAIQEADGNNIV